MQSSRMAEKSGASLLNFAEILKVDSADTRDNVLKQTGQKEREKSPAPFVQLQLDGDDAVQPDTIIMANKAL